MYYDNCVSMKCSLLTAAFRLSLCSFKHSGGREGEGQPQTRASCRKRVGRGGPSRPSPTLGPPLVNTNIPITVHRLLVDYTYLDQDYEAW